MLLKPVRSNFATTCKQGWKEGRNSDPVACVGEARLDQRATYLAALTLTGVSAFFDADAYDEPAYARAQGFEPTLHYVVVGEARGLKPSPCL